MHYPTLMLRNAIDRISQKDMIQKNVTNTLNRQKKLLKSGNGAGLVSSVPALPTTTGGSLVQVATVF